MSQTHKLTYFPIKGRAECARIMLHFAGVEFEDVIVSLDEWKEIKMDAKRFPQHQMPTLEWGGKLICQASAINRYLAHELGYYGDSNQQRADIDQVIESMNDIMSDSLPIFYHAARNPEKITKKLKELFDSDKVKTLFGFIQNMLLNNNEGKGFLVGDKATYADLYFFTGYDLIVDYCPELLDGFEHLKELQQRVLKNENLARYFANRPKRRTTLVA